MLVNDHHFWSLNLQSLVISSTFTGFICSHDDLMKVVFCEIHSHLFVLQKQLKETQKMLQQRIQQREKDLQQLRETVESHKVSLEKKRSLSPSQFRLTEAESLCVLTALCTDSSGGQWEDLYWAHPLHWEKPLWADTTDQRSGKDCSESSWRTTGATGAGDQWSEEERRWAGAAFTHTGSHPVPAGNTDLQEQGQSGLERKLSIMVNLIISLSCFSWTNLLNSTMRLHWCAWAVRWTFMFLADVLSSKLFPRKFT